MTVHKDIQIPFEIKGRWYEAVGFLHDGENSVSGYEMFVRTTNENGKTMSGIMSGEDEMFLWENRYHFPREIRNRYLFVTGWFMGDEIKYYRWYCSIDEWMVGYRPESGKWNCCYLVIRRRRA